MRCYEGIIETDRWFGPLFVNIKLTRPNVPIEFDANYPFLQVQPVHRERVRRCARIASRSSPELTELTPEDWEDLRQDRRAQSSDPHPHRDCAANTAPQPASGASRSPKPERQTTEPDSRCETLYSEGY